MNQHRWTNLMARLGLPESLGTWNTLVAAHREPTRYYHNVEHVTRCLDLVDDFREQISEADLVELAFWFHDAIYDTQSKANEEDSADWAVQFLEGTEASMEMTETVHDLIMATKHSAADLALSQQWTVDIDLSIWGAEPERFDQYERNIRLEYAWVPEEQFRQGRSALLEEFLAREWIYHTHAFRAMYEHQARKNLQRSIEQLR